MVLNNESIIEALDCGNIEITDYIWNNTTVVSQKFDPASLNGGHKIRLHVGFLVRTLSDTRWISPKVLYNKRDGIVDLRKLEEHKYVLQPKESVIIFTSEYVKTGSDYFGLILSRVSLEETGLLISYSYIDPNWDGILQLVVTNTSETPKLMQEHCEIANLILFRMDRPAERVVQKHNGHYGVSWDLIYNNAIYPKWQDRKRTFVTKVWHSVRTYWVAFTTLGIVGCCAVLYQIISLIMNLLK